MAYTSDRRKLLKRFNKKTTSTTDPNGLPVYGSLGGKLSTGESNPINTPDNYRSAPRLPKDQTISSAATRRAKRRDAGVSDVRTATPAQLRRIKRLGLL